MLSRLGAESSIVATAIKAPHIVSGSFFPRFSARRIIPRHAFGLKKYFGGTWGSKMADKEHAVPPLRQATPLCIQTCPRHTVPEFIQRGKDDAEVSAPMGREQSGNILKEKPARS